MQLAATVSWVPASTKGARMADDKNPADEPIEPASDDVEAHGGPKPRPNPGWEGEQSMADDDDVEAHGGPKPRPNPGWEGEQS